VQGSPRRSIRPLLSGLLQALLFWHGLAGPAFANLAEERELVTGPTNINAAVGNGGLSAAFSSRGEATVIRWPSPSHHDQLGYMTPVLTPGARDLPRMGAGEAMGVFAGLFFEVAGVSRVSWFRDPPWTADQRYRTDESNTVLTEYRNPELGVEVRFLAFVLPDTDVLAFRYELRREEGSPLESPSLVFFENASPCLDRLEHLFGITDWLLDVRNDFAALYDGRDDVLAHFLPAAGKGLLRAFEDLPAHPPADLERAVHGLLDRLDPAFGAGVYIAVGASRASCGRQVGMDAFQRCERPFPWSHRPEDAYRDASDARLSGSPAAACQVNAALAYPLDLSDGADRVTVYMAFGSTWAGEDGALSRLEAARLQEEDRLLEQTEQWWSGWIGRARMPRTGDARLLRVLKRALISIRTAADRETGAIVASLSTQPPYSLDWPRDGAFLNAVLDRAGYPEMVTLHNLFYARIQRKEPLLDAGGNRIAPAGTYATNYYSDGMEGWPIPFEIDNAGLAAWTLATHADWLHGDGRAAYVREIWPAVRLTATELAACRDPENGLPCLANEGESLALTQGLVGSVAVWLALDSALALGAEAGEDPALLERWAARREELEASLLRHFWNEEQGHFETGFPYPRGFVSWVIWPARLLPYDDPRMQRHAEKILSFIEPRLRKETGHALYDAEAVSALAHIWKNDPDRREAVQWALTVLSHELPTPGTDHFGEVYTVEDRPEGRVFQARTAIPHVWSGGLVYLAAVELLGTPAGQEEDPASAWYAGASGCGCRIASATDSVPRTLPEGLLFLALVLLPHGLFRLTRLVRSPGV